MANAIVLFLPGHDNYRFHITLAYVRVVAEGEDTARMEAMLEKMNSLIENRPAFDITEPYMAYYKDSLPFLPHGYQENKRKKNGVKSCTLKDSYKYTTYRQEKDREFSVMFLTEHSR